MYLMSQMNEMLMYTKLLILRVDNDQLPTGIHKFI